MKKINSDLFQAYYFNKIGRSALKKHIAFPFDEKFYNSLNLKFNNKTCGEKLKTELTNGCCYYYALLLAKSMPNSELKIGSLRKLDLNYDDAYYDKFIHSWVEKDNKVFDTTLKQVFEKDYYYKKYLPEIDSSFKHKELQDEKTFFKLGVNAIRFRKHLVNDFLEIEKDLVPVFWKDKKFIASCIKVINDADVLKEMDTTLNKMVHCNNEKKA